MLRLLLVVLALMAASVYGVRMLHEDGATAAKAVPPQPATQVSSGTRTVVIRADNGRFETDGRVDGRRIGFMVDTGATHVALRQSDADRLGYRTTERDYVMRISTANGMGLAAPIELNMVEVGDIRVRNVPAIVVPDGALGVNLLGMSFLSRVHWAHERGQLVIEQ